jgi:hypothetical protein
MGVSKFTIMKTNHQRNFRETRTGNEHHAKYVTVSIWEVVNDRIISASAFAGDHTNGKHGIAKDKRGAKKFVISRRRFHLKNELRTISPDE